MIRRQPIAAFAIHLSGLLGCACPVASGGPLPGALEAFPSDVNAGTWRVYDFADDSEYLPEWIDDGLDPYIGLDHIDDAPLWFFAGTGVAEGAFVGDYEEAGILGIGVDFLLGDGFEFLDCTVLTQGPFGRDYYFSGPVYGEDHPGSDWLQVDFWFDEPWYYWDAATNSFFEVQPDADFLAGIEEIGFEFFPLEGNTATTLAAIDNVVLIPTVTAPRLTCQVVGGQFEITFTPKPGTQCDLLRQVPGLADPWPAVAGQSEITGPETHHASVPLTAPSGLFRVRAEERYSQVAAPQGGRVSMAVEASAKTATRHESRVTD